MRINRPCIPLVKGSDFEENFRGFDLGKWTGFTYLSEASKESMLRGDYGPVVNW